jgi:hypothetical protein
MTWLPLMLADPSPCLRWLVLHDLLQRPPEDAELYELAQLRMRDPLVCELLDRQEPDGSWHAGDPAWMGQGSVIQATSLALSRLGYLGLNGQHPGVQRGAAYLFAQQQTDGAWPLHKEQAQDGDETSGYNMIPLQTALPLRALAMCGYATDSRAENAYDWLLAQRLEDGAWPTGTAQGNWGRVAGYRRLAHSRWGCRSNTTAALICLAYHPERRLSQPTRRALDLLLGRETREAHNLGYELARLVGCEPAHGFLTFFARYDLALVLDLAGRVGATQEDVRIAGMVEFVRNQQGQYGLWPYPPRPQAGRWVSFDLIRSLNRLEGEGEWFSLEPRTPFRAYPKAPRRF